MDGNTFTEDFKEKIDMQDYAKMYKTLFQFQTRAIVILQNGHYPSDVFSGIGKIGDKVVKCIDVENQILFHLNYKHDENDIHDVKLLCERFNIPVPNEYK